MSVEQREAKTCGRGGSPDNRQTGLHEPSGASATGLQGRRSEAANSASDFGSQLLRDTSTYAAREDSDLCSRFEPVPASLLGPAKRSASQTRILALALQRTHFPSFIKKSLESRWKVGPDVVRDILRDSGVDPGPEAGLRIPITDALLCEGFSEPLTVWISASAGCRKILSADLLTLEEWIARKPKKEQRDKSKYYRELSEGRLASVLIGKQHRFRSTLETALEWQVAGAESSS